MVLEDDSLQNPIIDIESLMAISKNIYENDNFI